MSDVVFKNVKTNPSGIVFSGGASTVEGNHFAFFIRSQESLGCSVLMTTVRGDWLMRMKLSELRKLRDVVNQAIDWMEYEHPPTKCKDR